MEVKLDKDKMKDEKGRYIVQGLFLEDKYNHEMALFTFDGEHKLYKGKTFYSLKKLYLEEMDPKEYLFARLYCFDWDHWKRMCKNKIIRRHIDQWREELELKLVSEGVGSLIHLALNENSYQAAKFLAERGWDKSERGRPSKEAVQGELKRRADEEADYNEDFEMIKLVKDK